MDNFNIDVRSCNRLSFDLAIHVAFTQDADNTRYEQKASHYLVSPDKGLIFLWHEDGPCHPLPFAMTWREAADFGWAWLQQVKYPELDHDDSDVTEKRGWRIYNSDSEYTLWNGHIGELTGAICAILPVWGWYGK